MVSGTGFYNYGQPQRDVLSSPTYLLIILNVLVFLVMLLSGDFGDCSSLACQLMAQNNAAVMQGAYWQLITAMFVHFGFLHIMLNMFALYYFGRLNETFFSTRNYLTIYFVSGLLGNVVSLFIPDLGVSAGASGAIFGLVGSYVAMARKARHMGAALLYAIVILILSSGMGVNSFAHVFGFVGGLVLGLILSRSKSSPEPGYSISYTYG